jgi:hypothetical protein
MIAAMYVHNAHKNLVCGTVVIIAVNVEPLFAMLVRILPTYSVIPFQKEHCHHSEFAESVLCI